MSRVHQAGSRSSVRPGFVFGLASFLVLLSGCAGTLQKATDLYYAERPEQALALLEESDTSGSRDRLLNLMERGLIEHDLGDYAASTRSLLQASRDIAGFETISASEQLGSLVTSEWLSRYKGEVSERLWVHSYLMMNFILQQEFESAQVEARKALKLFQKYPEVLKEDYFSRALMALCFERVGELNDAYLIYRGLAADLPDPGPVAADLVRIARRLGERDVVEHFMPDVVRPPQQGEGELVLFVAAGRIPRKQPGNVVLPPSIRFSFPYYRKPYAPEIQVELIPASPTFPPINSNFAQLAVASLAHRKAQIIAKETARVAGKEAIARSVGGAYGDTAEALTRLTLFILEEPDVRSWLTLPARMVLVRVPLPAGRHALQVKALGLGGRVSAIDLPEFDLRPGEKVFHSLRF